MPSGRLSYFPFYPADWFKSRERTMLEPDQRAAFLDLICLMYQSEDGIIADDLEYWSKFTGVSTDRLANVKQLLIECSTGVTHARVQAELRIIRARSEQNSRAGKRSAKLRRYNNKKRASAGAQRALNQHKHEHEHEQEQEQERSSAIADGIGSSSSPTRGEFEGQIPVARDRRADYQPAPWNDWGETASNSQPRDPESPWHTREWGRALRERRTLREQYIAELGRNPEEPPPGWVNRTGKWQFIGRPAAGSTS